MQLSEHASVKDFQDARVGNLLVGRFIEGARNFIAIRTEREGPDGGAIPFMAVLTSWVGGQDYPYLSDPAFGVVKVLDLGPGWSIDVNMDRSLPEFRLNPDPILVRVGMHFFIRMEEKPIFLDVTTSAVVNHLPSKEDAACWSAYRIILNQEKPGGPGGEIFHWPD